MTALKYDKQLLDDNDYLLKIVMDVYRIMESHRLAMNNVMSVIMDLEKIIKERSKNDPTNKKTGG